MITDWIVLALLVFFLISGLRKGIFKTLLGPVSLILGCLIAYIYYQKSRNLAISLSICILGPFAIRIIVSMAIGAWKTATRGKAPPSFLSRLLGGAVNVVWGGVYIVLVLLIVGLTPKDLPWFKDTQNNIFSSRSYQLVQEFLRQKIPAASADINKISALIDDPSLIKKFQSTKEFEELKEDESVLEILEDKELAKQIENKEYGKLVTNPKFRMLLNNEELIKKVFAFNKKVMEGKLEDEKTEAGPKVITIDK